jgi:NADPH:quinone reductase-like Zn-dependent oxidoreductase
MKAILFTQYGSADFLVLNDFTKPSTLENEVLVKVHAASINSWDWELLMGKPFVNRLEFGLFRPKKINILGCDLAGRVEAVGAKVTQFKTGDEVFGDLSTAGWGGFAEYVCAPESALLTKSENMTFEQAAAIPQAALLALQGLRDKGQIQSGQRVLINGAGGGVGTFALQLAKFFGAQVTGVDCASKLDIIRLAGADEVIDYSELDFTKNGQHYDLILDVAAYHSLTDYKRALSPSGHFVMVGGSMALANQLILFGWLNSTFSNKSTGILMHKANQGLSFIKDLFDAGKIVPIIDRTYPLIELAEALKFFEKGQANGKIVIRIKDEGRQK